MPRHAGPGHGVGTRQSRPSGWAVTGLQAGSSGRPSGPRLQGLGAPPLMPPPLKLTAREQEATQPPPQVDRLLLACLPHDQSSAAEASLTFSLSCFLHPHPSPSPQAGRVLRGPPMDAWLKMRRMYVEAQTLTTLPACSEPDVTSPLQPSVPTAQDLQQGEAWQGLHAQRGPPPLGREPPDESKGQTARVRAEAGGPGLTFPRTFLNTSVTSAHAAHCSHPFPTWSLILETYGAWTGRLWGGGHRVTSGHRCRGQSRRSLGRGLPL